MHTTQKDRYAIQSVEKALDVLEAISDLGGDVSLSRLSHQLPFNKTTLFRLLSTFEKRGYLEQRTLGSYRVGMVAFEVGQKLLGCMDLLQKTKSVMKSLARETNESIYLAVPSGKEVLMIDSVETTQLIQVMSLTGKRFPLEFTSVGKVIKAFTKKGKQDLELDQVQREEVCIENDSFSEGISSFAVPLFNGENQVEGCLCLVAPTIRFKSERVKNELLPALKIAAQSVSTQLGYRGYHNYT